MRTNIMASLVRIFGSVALIGLFCLCSALHPTSASTSSTSTATQSQTTTSTEKSTTTVTPHPLFKKVDSPTYFGGPSNATAVFVGGTPIMRFRVAAGGFTPEQRAAATQERVNKLLGEGPISTSDITTQMQGADAVVLVKGQLLFTADQATAQFNTMTPLQLADHWADNMRGVLPSLTRPK
ncbi:MAG TPA: hypothetical protein VFW40_02680 [Capsulimonadaceae bacterium]|nr:hypothetical protein [Capsulimonadaceae bacterium]